MSAVDPLTLLRPLSSVSLGDDELRVLGPDSSMWLVFATNAAGAGTGATQVYVDGLPAVGNVPTLTIGRITVNGDPFSAEYSDVGAVRIDVDLRAPERRWRSSLSPPSPAAGGGSTLGAAMQPVSRHSSAGLSGPVPRLPLTFSLQASHATDRRDALLVDPRSGLLGPAGQPKESRNSSLSAGLVFAGRRLLARATFSGSGMHVAHAGVGGINAPGTGQQLASRTRAAQTTWRIADGSRVHRGGFSYWRDGVDASADSQERLTRVTGVSSTGGDELAASRRRASAWAIKHVISASPGTWKAGFEGNRDTVSEARTPNPLGRLQLDAIDAATATWIVTRGNVSATAQTSAAALFAERVLVHKPRALMRGGVRLDWQDGAGLIASPRMQIATRIAGFHLSSGAGVFVQRWPPDLFLTTALAGGNGTQTFVVHQVQVDGHATVDPSEGERLSMMVAPSFERRRDLVLRAGVTRAFGAVQAGVEHTSTRGTSLAGAVRAREAGGLLDVVDSHRTLRRHQTSARASFRRGASSVTADYQHAWSYDDTDGALVMPARAGDVRGEWGRSSGVPRHAGGLTAMLRAPWQVRMSISAQARAGMPYTIITARDADGLATFTDRGGRPRNSGVLPPFFKLSVFASRTMKVPALDWLAFDVGVRADNVTNHRNVTSVGRVVGTPMFGMPLDAMAGRSVSVWAMLAR